MTSSSRFFLEHDFFRNPTAPDGIRDSLFQIVF